MAILVDWVKQTVSGTPGTGAITLGSAVSGFIRFQDDTRISDGSVVYYTIEDGTNRERGIGTYSTTGPTLTRTAIHAKIESGTYSENPGSGLSLTSAAVVSCSAIAATHNFRGCLLKKSSDQTISSATNTLLTFDTEVYDTDGFHDNVTNNSRITIPSGKGIKKVRISGVVIWAANGTGVRLGSIYKNGSESDAVIVRDMRQAVSVASTLTTNNVQSPVVDVSDGDFFELSSYHGAGSNLAVLASSGRTWFSLEIIE